MRGDYFMPQIMGSGAALFDFDNDGRLDIYLLQNGGPNSRSTNRLYHQEADGRFKDVSAGSGLDVAGYGMGVAIGDVNNDGWPDVLVTEYGRLRLFLNNGNGTFTDVTKEAGLDSVLWGASACFFDFDRDGWSWSTTSITALLVPAAMPPSRITVIPTPSAVLWPSFTTTSVRRANEV